MSFLLWGCCDSLPQAIGGLRGAAAGYSAGREPRVPLSGRSRKHAIAGESVISRLLAASWLRNCWISRSLRNPLAIIPQLPAVLWQGHLSIKWNIQIRFDYF
ncbi:hypothetical protein [Azotobacter beijerinckii]|uniref:hypothetical protein n=1 Tax=Azotobacter beijerinckii TaxID=170623 RepID=UPI00295597D7|nr:hypothetical protein [Azotobacter beijerinckii]MDV7213365.1 hypothetical protein [Azotobacter beijerinckii]